MSLPIVGRDAAVANADVLDALRRGADISNIFSDMPRSFGSSKRSEYSPAWDLQVGVYSPEAVSERRNGLKTDITQVRRQVASGDLTGPGGLALGSNNVIINCPALAFLDQAAGGVPVDKIAESRPVEPIAESEGATNRARVVPRTVNAGSGGQAAGDGTAPLLPTALVLTGAGFAVLAGRRLTQR